MKSVEGAVGALVDWAAVADKERNAAMALFGSGNLNSGFDFDFVTLHYCVFYYKRPGQKRHTES